MPTPHRAVRQPRLVDSEVHVWEAALDLPAAQVRAISEVLSADEWERAHRLVFERDRRRFIVCRGVLRTILGRYLGAAPGSLRFRYSRHGKPALWSASGEHPLRFSVSHAEDTALYGVTAQRDIGVDIECVRADFATDDIAERFFSRREISSLGTLSPADRPQAFFRCWTRKEAYLKARGDGLSLPLSRFDVSLLPDEPAALLSAPDDPRETSRWSLRDLPAGPGYVAAIAVEGHDWQLRCRRWAGTAMRDAGA
jgi:4'-phosphopantetheinyl transferase